MRNFKYEKSDKEKSLIDFVNQETNRLRQEAGGEDRVGRGEDESTRKTGIN